MPSIDLAHAIYHVLRHALPSGAGIRVYPVDSRMVACVTDRPRTAIVALLRVGYDVSVETGRIAVRAINATNS